jgi:hypothetical protein
MAPRLPFALDRLPKLPLDLLSALKILPGTARDTAAMAKHTAVPETMDGDRAGACPADVPGIDASGRVVEP